MDRILASSCQRSRWFAFQSSCNLERCEYGTVHKVVLGLATSGLEEQLMISTAEINAPDRVGRTPMLWASRRGDTSAVSTLLRYHADPTILDFRLETPLHVAAYCGHPSVISLLIKQSVNINAKNCYGETPLHLVAISGWIYDEYKSCETIELLLRAGAEVDCRDVDDTTPLMAALRDGKVERARVLLRNGAHINAVNKDGQTALAESVLRNRWRFVELLLDWGADYHAIDKNGDSILHLAAYHGGYYTIRELISAHVKNIDVSAKNYKGWTAEENS